MSTDDTSGNRWEPSPSSSESDPVSEHPSAGHAPVETGAAPPTRPGWRDELPGHRGWFAAGAAAVVFIVGGAGGFLVGHATAGADQDRNPFGQQGPRNGFGPGPGGNGRMPGQPPGQQPRSNGGDGQGSDGSHT